MKKFLPLSILLSSIFYLLFAAPLAHAQVTLVVSPPSFDIAGKPGDIIQKAIKVTNPSETEVLSLKGTISDFIVEDDLGTPIKVDTNSAGKYIASPWLTLDSQDIKLAPRETAVVNVIISIPLDALAGGHYAGIFFEPVVNLKKSDTTSYTSAQVGSLFAITIPGNLKYDAIVKEFDSDSRLYEFGPVNFKAVLENQSDLHIKPAGTITIKDMIGRKVGELKLDEHNIFPFTSRSFSAKWDQVWGLGKYSAEVAFTYGSGNVASRVIEFWILPYRLLAAIAVILLALIGIIVSTRRHLKHRADNRDQEIDELKRKIVELENDKR